MAVNFTPLLNVTADIAHYNISYTIANQPPLMTTPTIWILFILLGIGLLILSALIKEGAGQDLSGILGSVFLFISTIQAFAVDTITGSGVGQICLSAYGINCTATEWMYMENHIIYHYDLIGTVLAFLFLVSLANLYRIWLDYRRITNQQEIKVDMNYKTGRQNTNQSDDNTGKDREN